MNEFIQTKSQVLKDQNNIVQEEKRKCSALLDVKQNEIDNLTKALQDTSKHASDMAVRSEILAILAGKNKMLTRVKVIQMKAFMAFKKYHEWKKYKKVLALKTQKEYKIKLQKRAFQSWNKDYKQWKEVKDQERFENAVKCEI